tara:strand:- start:614 stop:850 length:237 start_codon:yes stop_codon:yes gene_type:complete
MKSIYVIKSEKLIYLRNKYKSNGGSEDLRKEVYKLDAELKEIDKSLGFSTSGGGNYKGNLKPMSSLDIIISYVKRLFQ